MFIPEKGQCTLAHLQEVELKGELFHRWQAPGIQRWFVCLQIVISHQQCQAWLVLLTVRSMFIEIIGDGKKKVLM